VYPKQAKEKEVEGLCIIEFVVTEKGSLEKIKLIKDIGQGCGEAALDVVGKMNAMDEKWIPALSRGVATDVMYTLPIKFKLKDK
jgi:protein TonB